MKKLFFIAVLFAAVSAIFPSCARQPVESVREIHEKILAAHVRVIHQDTLQKTESGAYYAVIRRGSGKSTTDSSMVFVRETVRDLNYNITASTNREVAKQMGTFNYDDAYIPLLWFMGKNSILSGLEEMLLGMKEGEIRRIWLPYWLSSYYEGGTSENSFSMVYDLELVKVVNDIDRYQIDTLEAFRNRHYPGIDSLERGFYKVTLVPGTGDSLQNATVVSTYYIGKFLNGHIFDTNIADTAMKYRIYKAGKDYSPLKVSMPVSDEVNGDTDEEGSTVKGFTKCMQEMRYGEIAVCFFHSDYGYMAEGKRSSSSSSTYLGGGIPSYMPLFFWIYAPLKN